MTTTNGKYQRHLQIEGKECVIHYDGVAYWVMLRASRLTKGNPLALARNENQQQAIAVATEALRLAAKRGTEL